MEGDSVSESSSNGRIRELLGEMSGTVRTINEQLREQKQELRAEVREVRDEQRQDKTALREHLDRLNAQMREVEKTSSVINAQVTQFTVSFGTVKETVDQLTKLKERLITYGAVAMTIFGVASYVIGPIVTELVHRVVTTVVGAKG